MNKTTFSYDRAFDRNLGWLTQQEQAQLRRSTVAIAGLGGAGGYQATAFARLGVGHFKIADMDVFELVNFNRQAGADVRTLGRAKVDVLYEMIRAINPTATVECYPQGISPENIDAFLKGADIALDGVDFFATEAKLLLFQRGRELGVDVITSCPLGFGASLLTFSASGMSHTDYFDLKKGMEIADIRNAMAFGLSPSPLCFRYMNQEAFNNDTGRAASVAPGLMIVGALAVTEGVKILTQKQEVRYCPHLWQIDFMTQKTKKRRYRWGMKSPWLRLKRWVILKYIGAKKRNRH